MSNHHLRSAVSAPRPLGAESDVVRPRAGAHAVLIVEDHEDTRDMYAMVLEASGYRVLMANSGAAALTHARNQTVSAVITDVCMPGTVTAAEICRIFSGVGIPVMVVTGLDQDSADVAATTAAGCAVLVRKPVDLVHLRATMDRLIPRRQIRA